MSFPNRTTDIGILINRYLQHKATLSDEAIHLLFAANRWELAPSIVDMLLDGTSVVCDRYAFSGVAYSVAKGLDFNWCQSPDIGLPAPDCVFFLRIDEASSSLREDFGATRYETVDMQGKVRVAFEQPDLWQGVQRCILDSCRSQGENQAEIRTAAEQILQTRPRPLRRLWLAEQ